MNRSTIGLSILGIAAAVGLSVGGWQLHWWAAQSTQNHMYDINTHSQQYQSGLVSAERDRAQGWDAATDTGQKANIKATFCAVYADLTQIPNDLAQDAARLGCS